MTHSMHRMKWFSNCILESRGGILQLTTYLQPSESQSLGVEAAPWKTFTRSQATVLCSMGCGGKKITGLKKYSNWLTVFKSGDRSFHKKAEKCKSNNKKNRPQERRDEERKKGMIFGRGGAEGWCCPEDLRDCRSAVSGRACTSIPLHVLFLPHKMLLSPSPPCNGHQISPPM